MKRAVVFSGQGTHRTGMCSSLLDLPSTASLWERMKETMMRNYGLSIQEVVQSNPTKVSLFEHALDFRNICGQSCHETANSAESGARVKTVSHANGVLSLTYLTQPCVLAMQLLALEKLRCSNLLNWAPEQASCFAGHSLGEFTALCALGVFTPECAMNLTFKRGALMDLAVSATQHKYLMYACSPTRARLHSDSQVSEDVFFVLVELISRALANTTSLLEVVNYNVLHDQYVVAGDTVGLAILGKTLDPQFRANCNSTSLDSVVMNALQSVKMDKLDGVSTKPNESTVKDFVTSAHKKYGAKATFRRFMRGPDDGYTPSLDQLTHLTLQEDGRSGLKKKSWFVPLSVEVPFHSSILRRCSEQFLPIVKDALPDEGKLRELLSVSEDNNANRPLWVTNLTGRVFRPLSSAYQNDVEEMMNSMNIGEVQHSGRHNGQSILDEFREGVRAQSVRQICAAVLASQLSHPVMWIDSMNEIVGTEGCRNILEISPSRNLSEMFRRSSFEGISTSDMWIKSYPHDGALLHT